MSIETKGKILVIDDDEAVLELAGAILKKAGYEVTKTDTVKAALELAHSEKFNLALCDLRLPDASGMDFLVKLRQENAFPVVIMTSFGSLHGVEEALKLGAKGFISKPLRSEHLLKIIKDVLAGKSMSWEKIISEENIYSYFPPPT